MTGLTALTAPSGRATKARLCSLALACLLLCAGAVHAQQHDESAGARNRDSGRHPQGPPDGPAAPGLHIGPPGRWWDDERIAGQLSLTADQRKNMDSIFESHRPALRDAFTALRREEAALDPLMSADHPDRDKVLAQVDRVAEARAQLEKVDARMLLELREQLTRDQWIRLRAERPPLHGFRRSGGPDGPPPPDDSSGSNSPPPR